MVRPILQYATQVLLYEHYYVHSTLDRTTILEEPSDFVKKIEHFQTQALKYLLGCPKSWSPAVVRLFSGVEPISCRIDYNNYDISGNCLIVMKLILPIGY